MSWSSVEILTTLPSDSDAPYWFPVREDPPKSTATATIPGLVSGTYALDAAHTEIGFTVRHLMTKVRGTFQEFAGEIVVKDSLEESTAAVTVELASVHTRNEQRDGHLRSGDFFDAENSPKMTYTSTGIKPEGDDWVCGKVGG